MAVSAQKMTVVKGPETVEGPSLNAKNPPNSTPEKESSSVLGREALIQVLSVAIVVYITKPTKLSKQTKPFFLARKAANRLAFLRILKDAKFSD